jgi:hypothetical protein
MLRNLSSSAQSKNLIEYRCTAIGRKAFSSYEIVARSVMFFAFSSFNGIEWGNQQRKVYFVKVRESTKRGTDAMCN